MVLRLLPLLLLPALLAGCGGASDRDDVRATVERFYDAVRDDRAEEACGLVSLPAREQLESQSGQACEDVITRLDYDGDEVVGAEVAITNAKVDLSGRESAFLGYGTNGWKLTAIACKVVDGPPRDRPLDCEVEA